MGEGFGYIINCLAVLDAPEEWYWSPADERLYFYPPTSAGEENSTALQNPLIKVNGEGELAVKGQVEPNEPHEVRRWCYCEGL